MITITVHSPTHVTVIRRPSWLGRLLGSRDSERDAQRIPRPDAWSPFTDQLVGPSCWIYGDNRDVEPEVAEAIERAQAMSREAP